MKRVRRRFRGELASPIVVPDGEPHEAHVRAEREWKLPLLAAEYGLDPAAPDVWRELALRLACDYVSGFRVSAAASRRRGRPRRKTEEDERLFMAMAHLVHREGKTIMEACRILAKRGGFNPDTLANRVHAMARRLEWTWREPVDEDGGTET